MTTAPDAAHGVPGARRNIPILGATSGLLNVAVQSWSPIIPLLLVREGAPAFGVVVTYALVNLLGAFAQYVGGRLADRYGARLLIGIPTTASGVLWAAMAFTHHWQIMAALYVVINVVFGLQNPSFVTLVADSVAPAERVAAFTRFQFYISWAYIAGPLLGALVVLPFVPPAVYIAGTGACYVAMGVIRLRTFVEPRRDLGRSAGTGGVGAAFQAARHAVLGTPARRRLLAMTVGVSALVALTVNGPFLALVGHSQDGLPARAVDLLFALGAVGMVAVSFFAGSLARRAGNGAVLALGLVVHGAAVALFALRLGLSGGALVFVLAFAGYQLASIAFGALRSSWAAGPDAGAAIGGASAVAGIAVFLVLSLAGALQASLGQGAPLLLAGVVAAVTGAAALLPQPGQGARPGRPVRAAAAGGGVQP